MTDNQVLLTNCATDTRIKAVEERLKVDNIVEKVSSGDAVGPNQELANIPDVNERLLNSGINKLSKSAEELKQQGKELKKELKDAKRDFKEIKKDVKNQYQLNVKESKQELSKIEERRAMYESMGFDPYEKVPITQKESDMRELVNRDSDVKKAKDEKRSTDSKALRTQSAVNAIKAKREFNKDIMDGSSLSADNLLDSGSKGLVGGVLRGINRLINPLERLKRWVASIIASLMSQLAALLFPIGMILLAIIVAVMCFMGVASSILSAFGIGGGAEPTKKAEELKPEKIEEIVTDVRDNEGLTDEQEKLLRFALSKVGCEYATDDSGMRDHPEQGYYDCSSLAYYCEKEIGKDITLDCAAGQAKKMFNADQYLPDKTTKPKVGDLIYYADPENEHAKDRWKHIYHVAVYVGNGYVVEAYGEDYGVIYGKLRSKNVFLICTP